MLKTYRGFLIETLPLIVGFVLQPFIHGEIQFTVVVITILLVSLAIRYYPGEWTLFFLGLTIGFVFEGLSGLIYRMQYWENASLLGIPVWLPIFWGYGFIFIHRLGTIVVRRNE